MQKIVICLLCFFAVASAFYLPGVAPKAYKKGDRLLIKVQSLTSEESSLTFDYYQLPFCPPEEVTEYAENLGEALLGEKSFLSPFLAYVLEDTHCNIVCLRDLSPKEVEEFQDFTILGYTVNMRADNLPLAQLIKLHFEDNQEEITYTLGHPVGTIGHDGEQYYLFNHLDFEIHYHPVDQDDVVAEDGSVIKDGGFFVVGFNVRPASIQHDIANTNTSCRQNCEISTCGIHNSNPNIPLMELNAHELQDSKLPILFTYSIKWEKK